MKLSDLLKMLLKAYFSPRVDDDFAPDDDTPPPDDDLPPDDDGAPPPDDDDTPPPDDDDTPPPNNDDDTPPPQPRLSRAQKAVIESRERAQRAERELATARAELETARRGPQTPPQPSADQLLYQQEEETLRNPETTDWQRYSINASRSARAAQSHAQQALRQAEDLSDRTQFAAIAATKPKLYAAYKDRVEKMLTDLRSRGNNAPREKLLAILVGEDMLAGKIKPSKTGGSKPSTAARAPSRSDVSTSGGARLSEAEKRAKRLENVRI